ncbi:ComEC/Rec2 family competence protein, partial [Candidatus Peregrinibacteria bacterium]|nr:ComEC/Rec2 family competence protein [Candidatus Peregrinibacteria bacterium]
LIGVYTDYRDPLRARFFIGKTVTLIGTTGDPPERISVHAFELDGQDFSLHGNIIARPASGTSWDYGDTLRLTGRLEQALGNDPRIDGIMNRPLVRVVAHSSEKNFRALLVAWRYGIEKRLNTIFPEPAASFSAGLLIGARRQIPRALLDDFRRTGLSHVLAISGFNMVLLIDFVMRVFSFLPKRWGLPAALAAVSSRCRTKWVTSTTATSLSTIRRAGTPRGASRKAATRATCSSIPPIFDIGFQLSVGATAGILIFQKRIEKLLAKAPNWLGMRENLAVSLAAQVFTTPLIAWHFQQFSIIAPIANLAVLPFIPLLMLGSFAAWLVSWFSDGALLFLISAPAFFLFEAVLAAVHFFSRLSFASIDWGIS